MEKQRMDRTLNAAPDVSQLDQRAINTIRFLSVDAIQKANSGHPGLPLGAAPMAYVLWTRFLRHNPANPHWFNRDRFVLSAGHGSMLLYSLLHLTGYALPREQLKQFRQWGSMTPGHPERGRTPGVETTTGPLGQGFGNGVGLAMAEAHLAARFNRPGFEIIDHFTYGLVSDGDLMEGVAAEAASLAGHLNLGKLIYLYDDNRITLAASTQLTFTEDRAQRFAAYGWHTQTVEDGNDLKALDEALCVARQETARPSLILVRTHLGFGSPHKQDTFSAHGSPLGEAEVNLTKQNLGWPIEPLFLVPAEVEQHFHQALLRGARAEADWEARLAAYEHNFPELGQELRGLIQGVRHQGRLRKGTPGPRTAPAGPDRRIRRPEPLHGNGAERCGQFPESRQGRGRPAGFSGGRLELCGPQRGIRRSRARHGGDPQWIGGPWRPDPLRGHLPDLFGLSAARNPPRSPDGLAGSLHLHP
jgi:transketolase